MSIVANFDLVRNSLATIKGRSIEAPDFKTPVIKRTKSKTARLYVTSSRAPRSARTGSALAGQAVFPGRCPSRTASRDRIPPGTRHT